LWWNATLVQALHTHPNSTATVVAVVVVLQARLGATIKLEVAIRAGAREAAVELLVEEGALLQLRCINVAI
jgi:hypothetical protein